MSILSVTTDYVDSYLSGKNLMSEISLRDAHRALQEKTCRGSDFLGWIDLPEEMTDEKIAEIQSYADNLRGKSDVLIVCGIGGSYLGARAIIEGFSDPYVSESCEVVFL